MICAESEACQNQNTATRQAWTVTAAGRTANMGADAHPDAKLLRLLHREERRGIRASPELQPSNHQEHQEEDEQENGTKRS